MKVSAYLRIFFQTLNKQIFKKKEKKENQVYKLFGIEVGERKKKKI